MFILHGGGQQVSACEQTVQRAQGLCCPGSGTTNVFTCLALGTTQRILLKRKVKKVRKLLMNQMLRRKRRRKKIMKLLD